MHDAARNDYQGIVDILLQHGADMNIKNDNGKLIIFILTYFISDNIIQYALNFFIPDIINIIKRVETK